MTDPMLGRPAEAADTSDEAAQWEAAAQIRREYPRWVVIWVARKGEFHARPLFRAPPGSIAAGATTAELTAQMEHISARCAAGVPELRGIH